VWFDTTAVPYLYDDAVYVQTINLVGDRLLFGSDYPLLRPSRYLPSFAKLSAQAKGAIYSHTAEALFGDRLRGA
jgi:predicted TIM-barrel fold metal-dependent hydrolase